MVFLQQGYYYDRRKNFYKNQGKPASKIFSIQYAAQAIEAVMNQSPAMARSKPTTLIKEDKSYDEIFGSDTPVVVFLKCCLSVQETAEFIKRDLTIKDREIARNFTYHLTRIAVSVVTQKACYTKKDIEKLNLSRFTKKNLLYAHELLTDLIRKYCSKFPRQNVINVSKSNKFVELINTSLEAQFLLKRRSASK